MKKKITILFCIIFIFFNFIYNSSYATGQEDIEIDVDVQDIFKDIQNHQGEVNGQKQTITGNEESTKSASAIIINVATFIVEWVNNIPQMIVEATGTCPENMKYFTIYSLVMGEYEVFDMDFTKVEKVENLDDAKLGTKIKYMVMNFYYKLRNLSLGISLFVLIYIGIRMAISTVSSDKAKYSKMLMDWVASIVLLFLMHFFIIGFSYLSNQALNLVKKLADIFNITNLEYDIFDGTVTQMGTSSGFHPLTSLITIAIFVYYQLKFFMAYFNRFCYIAILVVVAPLVTITYPIDKAGDGEAQAYKSWFKELSTKYTIQVVHAITYCVFISIAGEIARIAPVFAVVFLMGLDRAEKMFRKILSVNDDSFEKAKVPILDGKE